MTTTRKAHGGDVAAVRELVHAAYEHYVPRIGLVPAPMSADYDALVAAGEVWLAERDGVIAGVIVLEPHDDYLLVENVAVSPHAQASGLGTALLALAEREAAARGLRRPRLYTNEAMTENLAYYPRRGYVETHRHAAYGRRVYFAKTLP